MSAPAVREVLTPEGVPLRFEIALAADRAGAFLFDASLIVLGTILLVFPAVLALGTDAGPWLTALLYVGAFLLRHGYFIWFEVRRQGSTPGKRRAGLRVVDRRGAPLTAEAVFARNLTREVEVFLPLLLLLKPSALLPEAPGWGIFLGCGWIVGLAALPLFNRDRLRIGDIIAGTMVVRAPRVFLLRDLSGEPSGRPRARYAFTPEQLAIYGIYELQVLEEILRSQRTDARGLVSVCDRIRKKIGWDRSRRIDSPEDFLREFYDAQRAHLEGRLLMGDRRERKVDGPKR